jgi:hypothetical protein
VVKFILWGEGDGCREPTYAAQPRAAQLLKVGERETDGRRDDPIPAMRGLISAPSFCHPFMLAAEQVLSLGPARGRLAFPETMVK